VDLHADSFTCAAPRWRSCWACTKTSCRLITPEVGGGFGSKLNVYAEEALLGWISIQLGRPVKWIESRRENFQSTIHGRGQIGDIEIGFKKDGTLTGLRYNVIADMVRVLPALTPAIPSHRTHALGCYKIPRHSRSTSPASSPTRCPPTPIAARTPRGHLRGRARRRSRGVELG